MPSEIPTLSHSPKSISKSQIAEVAHWVFSWSSSVPRSAPALGPTSHQGECCGPSPAMTRRLSANSPAVSAQRTRIRLTRRWLVVSFAVCLGVSTLVPSLFFPRSLTSLRSCPICFLDELASYPGLSGCLLLLLTQSWVSAARISWHLWLFIAFRIVYQSLHKT